MKGYCIIMRTIALAGLIVSIGAAQTSEAASVKLSPFAGESADHLTALQEQLGLKLERRKAPLDIIVVDQAERIPTEN